MNSQTKYIDSILISVAEFIVLYITLYTCLLHLYLCTSGVGALLQVAKLTKSEYKCNYLSYLYILYMITI